MRKITDTVVDAFVERRAIKKDNTIVELIDGRLVRMTLFGNVIAVIESGELTIHHCGWMTKTTKERLNGILHRLFNSNYRVYIKKGQMYLNDTEFMQPIKIKL
jgi:hypothetical protein